MVCVQILLPMQTACGDFLAMIGMQDTVNTAAASCPAPLAPCTSYPEFTVYSQLVNEACCDESAAPCVAGLPTACGIACADVSSCDTQAS